MNIRTRNVLVALGLMLGLSLAWFAAHYPVLHYGVGQVPIYKMYVGDEQSPIFGALHMLESRNPLGLRNLKLVYYPPLFSAISLPAVGADVAYRFVTEHVRTALDYKTALVLDWTPLLFFTRLIALFFSLLCLYGIWLLFETETFNPNKNRWIPILGLLAISLNFYFFMYSGFFRHWIFVCASLVWQMYSLVRINETGKNKYWYLLLAATVFGLGISFIPVFYQIMLLPFLIIWLRKKDYGKLKQLAYYLVGLAAAFAILFLWSPYPYIKLLGFSGSDNGHMRILPSLTFYLKVIAINQVFLTLGVSICLVSALLRKAWKDIRFWMLGLPMFAHLLFFSAIVHSEPRYIMPFILLMYLVVISYLCATGVSRKFGIASIVLVLLVLETAYQSATIVRWSQLAWNGPKEFQAISQIRALPPGSSAIYIEGKILGAVHDKVSLDGYVAKCTDGSFDTFKFLQGLDMQKPGLHIDYFCNKKTSSGKPLESYDFVVTPMGEELASNYFEENLLRLWSAANLRSYHFQAKSTQ